jgi:hypothetical protein
LTGLAALSLSAALPAFAASPRLFAAARIDGKDNGAVWQAGALQPFALPARGHAPAALPDGRVLIVGRRPGVFAALVDENNVGAVPAILSPAGGKRFAGHGAVSPDGTALVTSEFEADSFRGALVVRDAQGGIRTVWDPQGIEPHDLLFLDSSRVIAALGGLIKDGGVAGPAFNPGGIDSAVIEIDVTSGAVVKRHALPASYRSLSLRHLAHANDVIVIGMQDQDLSEPRPVVGVLQPGAEIDLLPLPDRNACDFRGYIGSVAADRTGRYAAAASPRGSVLGVWSIADRRWIGGLHIQDVCGLTTGANDGEFWASSGLGDILRITVSDAGPVIAARWHSEAGFDNHLLRV